METKTSVAPRAYMTYYQDKVGKFRWRVVSRNGKTVGCASQGYVTMADCVKNSHVLGLALEAGDDQIPTPAAGPKYPLHF